MAVSAQQQAEIVEPADKALKLDAIDQENRHGCLGLANVI